MTDDALLYREMKATLASEPGRARFCKAIVAAGVAFLDNDEALRIAILRTMPYRAYLVTEHWRATSRAAKERAGHKCQLCNSPKDIETHHRTYERRGCEDESDLTVLCAECHGRHHTKPTPDESMEPQTYDAEEMRWAGMTEAEQIAELTATVHRKQQAMASGPEKPVSAILARKHTS